MTLTKIKYLRVHLSQEVKDLYSENWKILMKEFEDDTNKWNDICMSVFVYIYMSKPDTDGFVGMFWIQNTTIPSFFFFLQYIS